MVFECCWGLGVGVTVGKVEPVSGVGCSKCIPELRSKVAVVRFVGVEESAVWNGDERGVQMGPNGWYRCEKNECQCATGSESATRRRYRVEFTLRE